MKINSVALLSGVFFGFGLCLSEMLNPAVVIGFLDVTGDWNPALVFVMGGALLVTGISFRLIPMCDKPVCDVQFHLPQNSSVDRSLVLGAILFGVGWGLAGICPGPAVTALALVVPKAITFFVAMLVGMGLFIFLYK